MANESKHDTGGRSDAEACQLASINLPLTVRVRFDLSCNRHPPVHYVGSRLRTSLESRGRIHIQMETCKRRHCATCALSFPSSSFANVPPTSKPPLAPLPYCTPSRAYRGKYKLSRRKLVQRTLLILSRDNNYSLFLGRSAGNRFFSRLTGHFVDRARDPSFIRAGTIIPNVHRLAPQGGEDTSRA